MAVAKATTSVSLYTSRKYCPNAGDITYIVELCEIMKKTFREKKKTQMLKITKLAANVAETSP